MTRTGALVGTLDYVAPERIEGRRGDAAADIYSFGCMLYEALTGSLPFDRPTELGKMHAHVHEPPPSVRDVAPEVPPRARRRSSPGRWPRTRRTRFASAGELATALDRALDEAETVTAERQARAEADTDETDLPEAATAADATAREPTRQAKVVATAKPARTRQTGPVRRARPPGGRRRRRRRPARLRAAGAATRAGTPAATAKTTTSAPRAAAPGRLGRRARSTPRRPSASPAGGPAGHGPGRRPAVDRGARLAGICSASPSGQPTRSIAVGGTPQGVVADAGGRVWVTHTGARAADGLRPDRRHAPHA